LGGRRCGWVDDPARRSIDLAARDDKGEIGFAIETVEGAAVDLREPLRIDREAVKLGPARVVIIRVQLRWAGKDWIVAAVEDGNVRPERGLLLDAQPNGL
jgi:hypothetical protein